MFGDYFADSASRSAFLNHKRFSELLAAWNTESDAESQALSPDGTAVVTQKNGLVCILKLYHGNRRVSLAEAEEILASQKRRRKE